MEMTSRILTQYLECVDADAAEKRARAGKIERSFLPGRCAVSPISLMCQLLLLLLIQFLIGTSIQAMALERVVAQKEKAAPMSANPREC